jgi:hypothetical protein
MPGYTRRSKPLKGTVQLTDITNFSLSSPAEGDWIAYDSGSALWVNTKSVTGDYTITGSLTVNNIILDTDITLGGDLNATGNLDIAGNGEIDGTLIIGGTSTLAAVNATGAVALSSTLSVTGLLSGAGFSMSGSGTIAGNLDVTGALTTGTLILSALSVDSLTATLISSGDITSTGTVSGVTGSFSDGISAANAAITNAIDGGSFVLGGGLGSVTHDVTNMTIANLRQAGHLIFTGRESSTQTDVTLLTLDPDANLSLTPNGTGNVVLGTMTLDSDQTIGAGQDDYVLTYDDATGLISLEAAAGGSGATYAQDDTDHYELLYTTFVAAETDSLGLVINGVDTDTQPRINFLDDDGGTQVGNIRATNTGFVVDNRRTSGPLMLRAMDAAVQVVNLLHGDPDGALTGYYNANAAHRSALLGFDIADAENTGITALQFFNQAFATQHGVLLTNHSGTGIRLRSNIHGATVVLDGEDTGGTAVNILVGDPDGGVDQYFDATLQTSTVVNGFTVFSGASNNAHIRASDTNAETFLVRKLQTSQGGFAQFYNEETSAHLQLIGIDSDTTTERVMLNGDPDAGVGLGYNGTIVAETGAQGVHALHASAYFRLYAANGTTEQGQLAVSSGDLYLDNNTNGGDVFFRSSTASSVDETWLTHTNGGSVTLGFNGVPVVETTDQGMKVRHAGPYYRMYDAAGTTLLGQLTNSGGINYSDNNVTGGDFIWRASASGSVDTVFLTYDVSTDQLRVAGEIELDGDLNHDGTNIGFYGTAPIAQQTSVAVTAAGIHAALAALGLIT